MLSKQEIRQKIRAERNALSPEFMLRCEEQIFRRIRDFNQGISLSKARLVMGYSHFKNEVRTDLLKAFCLRKAISYCLPATQAPPHMDAYLVTEHTQLHPDSFGVPTPDANHCQKVNPEEIDLILIPGLAFDPAGNRLGYGKGYYDAFLSTAPRAVKIALAYEFQVLNQIPTSPWDLQMDYIITEKRLIRCLNSQEV